MRIRLLGVGVKMGIVDRGHAQSDDVIRCPETFADHEYMTASSDPFENLISNAYPSAFEKQSDRGLIVLLPFDMGHRSPVRGMNSFDS